MCCSHSASEQGLPSETRHRSPIAAHLLALLLGALTGCGGRVTGDEATVDGPPTGNGGASEGEGGMLVGVGGFPVLVGQGGTYASGQAGAATEECNEYGLWYAVTMSVGYALGWCSGGTCLRPYTTHVVGAVTLDAFGTVVGNTGPLLESEEAWIDEMADQRWPCLAGQTIEYCCDPNR